MIIPGSICYFISKKLENVRIFGLTGGVATGKSMLLRMINSRLKNLEIINCEKIMIEQMKKGRKGYYKIVKLFDKDS
jgi:dephospho-CoA kinase